MVLRMNDEVFALRKIWKRMRNRIKRLDNRGSALLTVILVATFLTILGTILMYITGMNYQIKQADYQNKRNFYTGEEALEEMKSRLIKDVSDAALLAHEDMAVYYASLTSEDMRKSMYYTCFYERMDELITDRMTMYGSVDNWMNSYSQTAQLEYPGIDPDTGNIVPGAGFTVEMNLDKYDANNNGSLDKSEAIVKDENHGYYEIKGIKVKYVDPETKNTTKISTNFKLTPPPIDWSANGTATALPAGIIDGAAVGDKELVTPVDCVIYSDWLKE